MHRVMKYAARTSAAVAMTLMTGTMLSQATPPEGNPNGTRPATEAEITSGKLASKPPVTYDNKYEIYGGLSFENFQAGQNLPKRMNMGGVEVMGTYWATHNFGVAADFRGQAGTTPVLANPYTSSPLVIRFAGMGGVQYRGHRTQRYALGLHALGGISYGDFTHTPLPPGYQVGLYSNGSHPVAALGASVDFNRSKNLAFRLSPDLILSHYGTETREFFAVSAGVVYRIGKK